MGSFPGPGTASGSPHRLPALPSSWPCASLGHPRTLAGPCRIRFRHLRPKLLGRAVLMTVLETSKNAVYPSGVALNCAELFHNLACFLHSSGSSLSRQGHASVSPSWVPLVTLFLPVVGGFAVFRHSEGRLSAMDNRPFQVSWQSAPLISRGQHARLTASDIPWRPAPAAAPRRDGYPGFPAPW